MTKCEIANTIRCKILGNNELTANLYATTSALEPNSVFSDDLPPLEMNEKEELEDKIFSISSEYYHRAAKIKKFVRTEIAKITDAKTLDVIDAYNFIVNALEIKRPELIKRMAENSQLGEVDSYKWVLEAFILPPERFFTADGSEITETW